MGTLPPAAGAAAEFEAPPPAAEPTSGAARGAAFSAQIRRVSRFGRRSALFV